LTHSGSLTHEVVTRQPWIRRRSGSPPATDRRSYHWATPRPRLRLQDHDRGAYRAPRHYTQLALGGEKRKNGKGGEERGSDGSEKREGRWAPHKFWKQIDAYEYRHIGLYFHFLLFLCLCTNKDFSKLHNLFRFPFVQKIMFMLTESQHFLRHKLYFKTAQIYFELTILWWVADEKPYSLVSIPFVISVSLHCSVLVYISYEIDFLLPYG